MCVHTHTLSLSHTHTLSLTHTPGMAGTCIARGNSRSSMLLGRPRSERACLLPQKTCGRTRSMSATGSTYMYVYTCVCLCMCINVYIHTQARHRHRHRHTCIPYSLGYLAVRKQGAGLRRVIHFGTRTTINSQKSAISHISRHHKEIFFFENFTYLHSMSSPPSPHVKHSFSCTICRRVCLVWVPCQLGGQNLFGTHSQKSVA